MPNKFNRHKLFFITIIISVIAGLTVYFVTIQKRVDKEVSSLEKRVALDLELRMLRLRYFYDAKRTDLSVLAESPEIQSYLAVFKQLKNPDYEALKNHFDGTASASQDEFINLYAKTTQWAKSCSSYFMIQDVMILNTSGDVIFSMGRMADFGSNVVTGPYADTGLGHVFGKIKANKGFHVSAFERYEPSGSSVCSFIGIALLEGEQFQGALVWQVPISRIQTEVGIKGALNYQQVLLHSDKLDYAFSGFDSTLNEDMITRSIPLVYMENNSEVLTASISERANIQYDRAYSAEVGMIVALLIMLLGLLVFKVYIRYTHSAVSATSAIIVQSTWSSIIDNPEKIGRDFYNNLFKTPAIAEVFKNLGHSPDLHKKLVSMMSMVVNHSDRLDTIESEIIKLAGMHVRMGVQPELIPAFIDAFVRTVEQQYDGEFSPKLRQAWYNLLNEVGRIFGEVIAKERDKVLQE